MSKGFEMILLDQGRTVTSTPKQGTSSVGGQKSGGPASAASSQQSTMQRNLDVTTSGVANLELSSKSAHQSQRLKDKTFRVHAFSNKAPQFHAADLFDIESCALDLSQCVKGLTPYLVLQVCQTPSATAGTSSKVAASGETSPSTVGDILSPLLLKIGGLHSLVDNRVHLQQSASMSAVGYNAFYTFKYSQSNGLKNYGLTRASRNFLTQDQKAVDTAARHSKARQKLLSSEQRRHPKSGVDTVGTAGGDGNPKSKASRRKHNR